VKSIALHVGTRNATQVRTHAQKYYLRIDREKKRKEEKKFKEKEQGIKAEHGMLAHFSLLQYSFTLVASSGRLS